MNDNSIPKMSPVEQMGLQSANELEAEYQQRFCLISTPGHQTDRAHPRLNINKYIYSIPGKLNGTVYCEIGEVWDTSIRAWFKRPEGTYGRYVKHLQESIQTHGALKTLFEAKKKEHDLIQADIAALTTSIFSLTAQLAEIERSIIAEEQDELKCIEAIEVLEEEQISLTEELNKLEEGFATLEKEKEFLSQQVESQNRTIASLKQENQELESQLEKQQESDKQKLSALRAKSIGTQTDNTDLLAQLLSKVKTMAFNFESSAAASLASSQCPSDLEQ